MNVETFFLSSCCLLSSFFPLSRMVKLCNWNSSPCTSSLLALNFYIFLIFIIVGGSIIDDEASFFFVVNAVSYRIDRMYKSRFNNDHFWMHFSVAFFAALLVLLWGKLIWEEKGNCSSEREMKCIERWKALYKKCSLHKFSSPDCPR